MPFVFPYTPDEKIFFASRLTARQQLRFRLCPNDTWISGVDDGECGVDEIDVRERYNALGTPLRDTAPYHHHIRYICLCHRVGENAPIAFAFAAL